MTKCVLHILFGSHGIEEGIHSPTLMKVAKHKQYDCVLR